MLWLLRSASSAVHSGRIALRILSSHGLHRAAIRIGCVLRAGDASSIRPRGEMSLTLITRGRLDEFGDKRGARSCKHSAVVGYWWMKRSVVARLGREGRGRGFERFERGEARRRRGGGAASLCARLACRFVEPVFTTRWVGDGMQ